MAVDGQRAGSRPLTLRPGPAAARPDGARRAPWRNPLVLVWGPALIGLIHVALVAPHYHVGSFDDDASYVLSAKALLAGGGLKAHLVSGEPLVGLYLPGYGALLAPLVWVAPHSLVDLRVLSVLLYLAAFPLTATWMRRRAMGDAVVLGALVVMALGPVFATFASMVMAEAPFIDLLLLLLLVTDKWLSSPRVLGWPGVGVLVSAAALVWLKQAGIGLVIGLVLWLPLSRAARRWSKALALAGWMVLSVLPVLLERATLGIPLAGDRYSEELGGYYRGSLGDRLVHVLPASTWHLLFTAIPATLVPYVSPLPLAGSWPDLWEALSWQVTILCAIGAVTWFRRHRDPALAMTVVYLGETALWPFVNERRAILVLPLLVAWYALGAAVLLSAARRLAARTARIRQVHVSAAAVTIAVVVSGAPLVAQAPRDYLFGWGQSSSDPQGSRYMALLSALGPRSAVVETDYRSTVALFSGHPTAWGAITAAGSICYEPGVLHDLESDRAAYLIVADFNRPGVIDSACLADLAATGDWAVPLLHTDRDNATVYELVGPYSTHPALTNELPSATPPLESQDGDETVWSWDWVAPVPVSQISVGNAHALSGPTGSFLVEIRRPDGVWSTLQQGSGGVGDCAACRPFLLDHLGSTPEVTSVRVVVSAPAPAVVSDLAVIGPTAGPTTRS